MKTRYTVELTRKHKYYCWMTSTGFLLMDIKPEELYTIQEDEDYSMAVF